MSDDHLLTRDGHLTELAAARHALGELDDDERARVDEHLDACDACRAQYDADRAFDAALELPAFDELVPAEEPPGATVVEFPRWAAPLAVLVAAAAAFLWWTEHRPTTPKPVASAPPPTTGFRPKGAPLTLEVFVHDGASSRRADPDEPVRPGDRLGFRVGAKAGGHLVIAGIDAAREPYLCYPQADGGASAALPKGTRSKALDEAVVLDDQPGVERIVGVLCDRPFHYREVASALVSAGGAEGPLPRLLPGCTQRELRLTKQPPDDAGAEER